MNPESQLIMDLTALHSRWHKRLDCVLSVHGISYTEFQVMACLNKAPDRTLRRIDLAQAIALTASGVTRLLNPMQKIGLVKKQESARDARVSLVALTKTGQKIFAEAQGSLDRCAKDLLGPLPAGGRTALVAAVSALH